MKAPHQLVEGRRLAAVGAAREIMLRSPVVRIRVRHILRRLPGEYGRDPRIISRNSRPAVTAAGQLPGERRSCCQEGLQVADREPRGCLCTMRWQFEQRRRRSAAFVLVPGSSCEIGTTWWHSILSAPSLPYMQSTGAASGCRSWREPRDVLPGIPVAAGIPVPVLVAQETVSQAAGAAARWLTALDPLAHAMDPLTVLSGDAQVRKGSSRGSSVLFGKMMVTPSWTSAPEAGCSTRR